MLKQIAEVMVQRVCHCLIMAVATAATSVHSPLYLSLEWLGLAQQVAVAPVVDDVGCIPAER